MTIDPAPRSAIKTATALVIRSVPNTLTSNARPPACSTSLPTAAMRRSSRATSTTEAPSRAKTRADSRPKPGPTPERTATFPSSNMPGYLRPLPIPLADQARGHISPSPPVLS
jgi:hypothetical protein